MKSYLAFKAVRDDLTSLWVQGRLLRKYAVGKTLKTHPDFPLFLISRYPSNDWKIECGAPWNKLILVRVPANHIAFSLPWAFGMFIDKGNSLGPHETTPLNKLATLMSSSHGVGATRLTVLREVDLKYASALDAMEAYESKYAIPSITKYPNYPSLIAA